MAREIAPKPPNDSIPEPEFNPFASAEATPVTAVVETIIEEREVRSMIPQLKEAGACDIIEYPLNKVID